VVKTTSDSYVGRISLVRVFSGTLRPDASVHVSGHGRAASGHEDHDDDERIGALTSPLGKQQRPVTQCAAGDICAVAKLSTAETGDTLSDKDNPLLMESWSMPGAAAAGGDRGQVQGRRGQALPGAEPAGRRGPDAAPGE
jgi:elongation factor G